MIFCTGQKGCPLSEDRLHPKLEDEDRSASESHTQGEKRKSSQQESESEPSAKKIGISLNFKNSKAANSPKDDVGKKPVAPIKMSLGVQVRSDDPQGEKNRANNSALTQGEGRDVKFSKEYSSNEGGRVSFSMIMTATYSSLARPKNEKERNLDPIMAFWRRLHSVRAIFVLQKHKETQPFVKKTSASVAKAFNADEDVSCDSTSSRFQNSMLGKLISAENI